MQSEIRVDSDEMSVEGRVMDFRERDAVADHRLTKHFVLIFDDMSGVEKHGLGNPDRAHRNCFSKRRLMKTCLMVRKAYRRSISVAGGVRLFCPGRPNAMRARFDDLSHPPMKAGRMA